jgi:hypothetical protein
MKDPSIAGPFTPSGDYSVGNLPVDVTVSLKRKRVTPDNSLTDYKTEAKKSDGPANSLTREYGSFSVESLRNVRDLLGKTALLEPKQGVRLNTLRPSSGNPTFPLLKQQLY